MGYDSILHWRSNLWLSLLGSSLWMVELMPRAIFTQSQFDDLRITPERQVDRQIEIREIDGWFGHESHYYVDNELVGAILDNTTVRDSAKKNYMYVARRYPLDRHWGKKYYVVVPSLPRITGPYYQADAKTEIMRIINDNA